MKTNITHLIGIYNACKSEKRDDETICGQLQGEVYSNCKDVKIAKKVGEDVFNIIQELNPTKNGLFPSHLTAYRKAIDNALLIKHKEYLRSSYIL